MSYQQHRLCRAATVGDCGECDRLVLVLEFDSARELADFLRAPWTVEQVPALKMSKRRRAILIADARRVEAHRLEFLAAAADRMVP